MAVQGERDNYYNNQAYQQPQQPQHNQPYGAQGQYQYPPPSQPPEAKYQQTPPDYGQNYQPPQDGKQTFDQTFKIEKPKWNDLWAGILVGALDHKYAFDRG